MGEPIRIPRPINFEILYPMVEDAILEYTEEGKDVYRFGETKGDYHHKISLKQYGDLIICSNSLCRRGGFELSLELARIVNNKETVKEDYKGCLGWEGSPKLRRKYRRCCNMIKYRLTLIYKSEAERKNFKKHYEHGE